MPITQMYPIKTLILPTKPTISLPVQGKALLRLTITYLLLNAEKKYRKFRTGEVHYSHETSKAMKKL